MRSLSTLLGLALLLPGCRQQPPDELDGVEPWKAAMFCSTAMDRSARILVDLAWTSEDVVERDELTREATERREAALDFGKRGIALAEKQGVEQEAIRKALDDSEALFDQQLQDAQPVDGYAKLLADRIGFCRNMVLPSLAVA